MIKRQTKSEIRESLSSEVDEFIKQGGQIKKFDQGDSSLIDGRYDRNQFVYGFPKQSRTPVPDTMQQIDQRKTQVQKSAPATKTRRVKKIIYDDFGDPVREIWVEE
jgi:hypothetical protein